MPAIYNRFDGILLHPPNTISSKKDATRIFFSRIPVLPKRLADSVILGDNVQHLANLSAWLKRSESSKWKRCWRASVDGSAASTFHSGCDDKGPTVTIIRVGGTYIFGGYTNLSWGKL